MERIKYLIYRPAGNDTALVYGTNYTKEMKKKIISILLSSAMIFSMGISTVSAAAADDTAATESIANGRWRILWKCY